MNKKLACLVDQQEQSSQVVSNENCDCFLCKNDQELYIKAMEKKKVIKCIICSKLQHVVCYNIQAITDQVTQFFACIPCRILQTQPDILQFDSIVAPIVMQSKDKYDTCEFKLQEVEYLKLFNNSNSELCIYCMKVDLFDSLGKHQYYSWPSDNIVIKINNMLQTYQIDSLCYIDKNDLVYQRNNTFSYNMGEIQSKDQKTIIIGIGLVQLGNMNQLIEKIILSQTVSEQEIIKQYKEWSKDLEIIIPIKDQITQTLIKWPIRGKNCTHFTCVDMYSYLEINLNNQKLEKYRWSCPTCQARLYVKDILFDKYLYKYIKSEIQSKMQQDHIALVEEVVCDQNGNLKIGDESQHRIKMFQMKQYLIYENMKIEKNLNQSKKVFEDTIKEQMNKKLSQPLELPKITNEEIETQLTEFKQKYPKINKDSLQQILTNEYQLIIDLNPFELVYHLMRHYDNLKDLTSPTYADIMYQQDIDSVVQVLKNIMRYNELQFSFIRFYCLELSDGDESKYCSYVAQCILLLMRKDQSQYFKFDHITTSFILLTTQYSVYEKSISNILPGIFIGGALFFYKSILSLSFDRTCLLIRKFINLTGKDSFYLSLQQQSIDLLADVVSSFLQLQYSTNESFDQVLFFQKIFFNKTEINFDDINQLDTQQQICLFKSINQTLFRLDPSFNEVPFKKAKEFISLIVQKNKDIINDLKTIQNYIF